jgi:hypothetical protein
MRREKEVRGEGQKEEQAKKGEGEGKWKCLDGALLASSSLVLLVGIVGSGDVCHCLCNISRCKCR